MPHTEGALYYRILGLISIHVSAGGVVRMMRRGWSAVVVAAVSSLFFAAAPASAQNLVDLLPKLLKDGAVLAQPSSLLLPTQIDPNARDLSQSFVPAVTLTTVPQQLNAALGLQLATG